MHFWSGIPASLQADLVSLVEQVVWELDAETIAARVQKVNIRGVLNKGSAYLPCLAFALSIFFIRKDFSASDDIFSVAQVLK